MKINAKTFAGVGVGLVAGYFLIKSKKPLYIIGTGLAGGILANLILNRSDKKAVTLSSNKYITPSEEELVEEDLGNVELEQTPVVSANLRETSPQDYFDIDLDFNS